MKWQASHRGTLWLLFYKWNVEVLYMLSVHTVLPQILPFFLACFVPHHNRTLLHSSCIVSKLNQNIMELYCSNVECARPSAVQQFTASIEPPLLPHFPSLPLHWGQREDCISMQHGTEALNTIWFRRPLGSISTWPAPCLGSFCGCQFRALTWITMLSQWGSGILPKVSKR